MLISSDSHVVEPFDLWATRLPRSLRDRAPVARKDPDNHHWYFTAEDVPKGVDMTLASSAGMTTDEVDAILTEDPDADIGTAGGHDGVARLRDLWEDDTVADVLYPTAGLSLLQITDAELQCECFRVYNDWLAAVCEVDPARLVGHALIPMYDVDDGVAELQRAREKGLRGAVIWTSPPVSDSFFDPRYERLWAAAADLRMPIALHTLAGQRESRDIEQFGRTVQSTFYFSFRSRNELQRSLCELIASGAFARHPDLRIIGAEGGINYAAIMEQRLDSGFKGFWGKLDHDLELLPSEYFRRNVYLTYISDPIGLNNLSFTGADHFMWSGDYPHHAASWPNSVATVREETGRAGLDDETVRKLTLTNVANLYGIDLDEVAVPSPAIGVTAAPAT